MQAFQKSKHPSFHNFELAQHLHQVDYVFVVTAFG